MSDEQEQINRAQDVAQKIAVTEMLRLLISHVLYKEDKDEFRKIMQAFEQHAVDNILSRRHFEEANDATEQFIKEAAASYVTKTLSSIVHR